MSVHAASLIADVFRNSPLRHGRFRLFYVGSVAAALGYTMQATVAAWLMATLTPSALMVALVQTASTAPSLLFGLLAGALADIVDRRRVVLMTQALLFAATVSLGIATLIGWIGPLTLLALTFLIGAGFTFYMPAQQASVNDLVLRQDLPRAVALSAVAFNLARAVGPALAGAIAAWIGTGSASIASACFFVVTIVAVRAWKKTTPALPGVPERLLAGVWSGLRYARHSPLMRALIIRNLSFSVCASALWALLPVIARDQLSLGAGGFGLLSAGFGTGAVIGAMTIPRQIQRVSLNTVVSASILLWVAATVLIASTATTAVALVGMFGAGAAWVGVLASLSAGTQSAAPAWVRARAVAMNLVAVQASLALGSAVWGSLASLYGISIALFASAGVMLFLLILNRRVRVRLGNDADVMPGAQLPDLGLAVPPLPDDGPVLIQVEYRIAPENMTEFLRAIHAIERTRRRNGADDWRVFRDIAEQDCFVERYIISSWAEYVRQRSRMTVSDRQLQERVAKLQQPEVEIRVSRLIGIDPRHVAETVSKSVDSD
ncbi:MAG TPA: MFS transporter [Casimicrobiaceae bacterium]|nr:MFS transporter [Casimicrobiaceae bacterium]